MGDTGIFRGLVNRQLLTPKQAERQNRRKYLFALLLEGLIFLLAIVFGTKGLWQAWQTDRWDVSFWINTLLLLVFGPLVSGLPNSLSLAQYFLGRANEHVQGRPRTPANRKVVALIGFTPLLLAVLFAATAFGLQNYESYFYHTLLAQVQTHKPLYQHAAETFPPYNYYVQGLNHIPFGTPVFQTPDTYGDSAVEVTVQLTSKESFPGQSTDSLGLLLRGSSTETGIIFQISPNGDWSIGRPSEEEKDTAQTYRHHTSAIHTAPGASNRLAVIMHANQYICFVNDQLLGIYQDSGSPRGPIGFHLDTDTASAAFTDFTIYPL